MTIMSEAARIKVATYNVGDYSGRDNATAGSEESKKLFRKVFTDIGADLWALQEDVDLFNKETGETAFDAIYSTALPNYKKFFTWKYNGKAFLSKFELQDVRMVKYKHDEYQHPWYLLGTITVEGKEITIISLHLDWAHKHKRSKQLKQLLDFARTQEYCIVMGDFNPEDYIDFKRLSNTLYYKEEFGRFESLGFTSANTGEFGTFDTIRADGFVRPCPFDNIIVSKNIKIVAAGCLAEPWMNDHAPVWAELEIN